MIELPYGKTLLSFSLPPTAQPDWIIPPETDPAPDPIACVQNALDSPVGTTTLDGFKGAGPVVIAINDKTRPVPHAALLPPLLRRLESLGHSPESIHLLIATGTHLPMQPEEFPLILPQEILRRYPVKSHDCDAGDLVNLGATSRGTPILVNRLFYEAGLRIAIGNIEPHHFMGFSGGAKTAAIGLTGRATINRNHAMLPDPNAKTGHYHDNPMRLDVEEIGLKIGLHYVVNAILNLEKAIVQVLSGDPQSVMEEGIPLAEKVCQVPIEHPYDLVIASPGGYPKDINFYQSQKALTHAAMLTRDGGSVILCAACKEGIGSAAYEGFMQGVATHKEAIERFNREGFRVGPHKALQVALIAARVRVSLISEMSPKMVAGLLLQPYTNIQQAVTTELGNLSAGSRIAIMPYAVSSVPLLRPS